ncbi:MAG: ferrochelatase, partial [Acidimicrobiia bacterium]|nr:ferrochelatase [Acidimicrobiia bacterium]
MSRRRSILDVIAADAILLLSFGGPEGPDDVMPFLRNVTRGRGVPDERLAVVAEQYALFGGRSPLNDQCRDLLAALRPELGDH